MVQAAIALLIVARAAYWFARAYQQKKKLTTRVSPPKVIQTVSGSLGVHPSGSFFTC